MRKWASALSGCFRLGGSLVVATRRGRPYSVPCRGRQEVRKVGSIEHLSGSTRTKPIRTPGNSCSLRCFRNSLGVSRIPCVPSSPRCSSVTSVLLHRPEFLVFLG